MPLCALLGVVVYIVITYAEFADAEVAKNDHPVFTTQPLIRLPPLNDYVIIGQTVTLACEAIVVPPASTVTWFSCGLNETCQAVSKDADILDEHVNAERYRIINKKKAQFDLQISSAVLSDAGQYVCVVECEEEITEAAAQLTVLESDPSCTSDIPHTGIMMRDDNYTISCRLSYNGSIVPRMTWTGVGFIQNHWITDTVTETAIESTLTFTADLSTDSNSLRCRTNFTEPEGVEDEGAKNAPNYEHIWETEPLHTLWGPRNITIHPIKESYEVGDVITCLADSRPQPSFIWQYIDGPIVVFYHEFIVASAMAGKECMMKCQAFNIIDGFSNSVATVMTIRVEE